MWDSKCVCEWPGVRKDEHPSGVRPFSQAVPDVLPETGYLANPGVAVGTATPG